MKRFMILTFVLLIGLLAACTSSSPTAPEDAVSAPSLKVSGGDISKSYTRADLEALTVTQAIFNDVTYKGVTVTALIQDAGFDPTLVKAIKAVAADGYTVNYDTSQILAEGVILAYARADGDLAADDGSFRIVMPGAEGKLNPRMLVEIQVIQ